jgi:hypothetical protein
LAPASVPNRNARGEGREWRTRTSVNDALGRRLRRTDALLVGERAATSGHIATEGGDEHAGVKRRVICQSSSPANRIERRARTPKRVTEPMTRVSPPGSCPAPPSPQRPSSASAPRRAVAAQRKVAMSAPVSAENDATRTQTLSTPGRLVAHHDVPLIDERAAARGRCATEGGDEYAGVKRRCLPDLANRIERLEPRRVGGDSTAEARSVSAEPYCPMGLDGPLRVRARPPPSLGTMRRSSANARAQRKYGDEHADAKTYRLAAGTRPSDPGVSCVLIYRSKRSISFA